jgi:hypothetical protein
VAAAVAAVPLCPFAGAGWPVGQVRVRVRYTVRRALIDTGIRQQDTKWWWWCLNVVIVIVIAGDVQAA